MTKFKVGDKVRTVRTTWSGLGSRIEKGFEGVVEDEDFGFSATIGIRGADRYYVMDTKDIELVPAESVVKEGDEVELQITVTGKVRKDWAGNLSIESAGVIPLSSAELISHTPAAPVLKPGTFGWATVGGVRRQGFIDGRGFIFYGREGSDHSFPEEFSDFEPDVPETVIPEHAEEVLQRVVSNTLFRMGKTDTDLPVDGHDRLVMEGMKELRDGVPGPPLMAGTESPSSKVDRTELEIIVSNVLFDRNKDAAYAVDGGDLAAVVNAVLEELGLE